MLIKTEMSEMQDHLTDASNIKGGFATKIYFPQTVDELIEAVKDAGSSGESITVSAGRTGTVGGAIPFGGAIISLDKLNKIKSIDKQNRSAIVEPGVILADLQKAVESDGLFYPPDPTEWSCQIGGTVATNASGARSFKYGATRNYVNRLNIVLADGDILVIARGENFADNDGTIQLRTIGGREFKFKIPAYPDLSVRKNVSGYYSKPQMDAIDIFIGSEGTLGIIAEIELKLLAKPKGFFSGIIFFDRENDLLSFVDAVKAASFNSRAGEPGIDASLIEYFDANALSFISEKFPETPQNKAGAIFFEQETDEGNEDRLLEAWNDLLEANNADLENSWFTTGDGDREKMRAFRHALPVSVNERIARYQQKKIGTDMAISDDKFAGFLRFTQAKLNESGLDHVIFGHIGDCHLHANMLPKNDEEAIAARHLYGRFIAQAIMLGGVVSAEHGIGKHKTKYLNAMMGERYLNQMVEVKKALDPNGVLGRGNIFEEKFLA